MRSDQQEWSRLIVEHVHRVSSRPWAFVTGRFEGDQLRIGDELVVAHGELRVASAVIRSVELHSPPGKTTVAIDAEIADFVRDGTELTRA